MSSNSLINLFLLGFPNQSLCTVFLLMKAHLRRFGDSRGLKALKVMSKALYYLPTFDLNALVRNLTTSTLFGAFLKPAIHK